jgi:hypothetical protein
MNVCGTGTPGTINNKIISVVEIVCTHTRLLTALEEGIPTKIHSGKHKKKLFFKK